jgi:hypothetical protein
MSASHGHLCLQLPQLLLFVVLLDSLLLRQFLIWRLG